MSHLVTISSSLPPASNHHKNIPVKQIEMFGQPPTTVQSSVASLTTHTSSILTPTSPYTDYIHRNSNNNSIYPLTGQDITTSLDMKTFTSSYSDYTDPFPSCAETPSSVFSDPCTPSSYNPNDITFREDVFRFEPEDIERLTKTCHYNETITSQTSTLSAVTTANLNFDIEYFNYDEINCQSKNQSPCSSPQLMDPWMTLNLRDTYTTSATSPKITNNNNTKNNIQFPSFTYNLNHQQVHQADLNFLYHPQAGASIDSMRVKDECSSVTVVEGGNTVSRENSVADKFILQSYSKLPSMNSIGTFETTTTTVKYSSSTPRTQSCSSSSGPLHVETIAYDELTTASPDQDQNDEEVHVHDQFQHSTFYSPKSDECNDSYEHLPENYNSSELMMHEKPNRVHKNIWTIEEIKGETDLEEVVINSFSSSSRVAHIRPGDYDNNEPFDCDDDNTLNGAHSAAAATPTDTGDDDGRVGDSSSIRTAPDIDDDNDDDSVFMEIQETPYNSTTTIATTMGDDDDGQSSSLLASLVNQLECQWTDCNEVFPNQEEFVAHIEKRHVDVKKGDDFSCFWLDCPRRYKPFNARYKLLIHMRVHSGEKPNKCPFSGCNKAFSRLENLKIHQRSHTGERPYGCQYKGCLKAFSNSSDRAKHQRTHYDTKPYACQIAGCTKRYTDPSSLRKHVKNHSLRNGNINGRRKSSSASINNSLTTTSARLQSKIRRHSESSLPAVCATVTMTTTATATTTTPTKPLTTQNTNSTTASMISSNNKLVRNQHQQQSQHQYQFQQQNHHHFQHQHQRQQPSEHCQNHHYTHQHDRHQQTLHPLHEPDDFFQSDYLLFEDAFAVGNNNKSSSTRTGSEEFNKTAAQTTYSSNDINTSHGDYATAIREHYPVGNIKLQSPYTHQENDTSPRAQLSFSTSSPMPSTSTTTTTTTKTNLSNPTANVVPATILPSTDNNSMNFNELSNCIVTIESNQNENSIDGCQMESGYIGLYHQHDGIDDVSSLSGANDCIIVHSSPSTIEQISASATAATATTTSGDNAVDIDCNEFVSFEYVKKLLSDTFDYVDAGEQQLNCHGSTGAASDTNEDDDLENNFDIEYLNDFI